MTHVAEKKWAGNYIYRGYTLNKNLRVWDIYETTYSAGRTSYAWTLSEAKSKVDNIIDRGCEWKDA